MGSISLTFKKLLHVVCITGMDSLLWLQNAELQRQGNRCYSMAMVHSWENSLLYLDFMSSFPRNGKNKKVIEGPGGDRLTTFSWKDDVTNQKSSSKNTLTLISNKIINVF